MLNKSLNEYSKLLIYSYEESSLFLFVEVAVATCLNFLYFIARNTKCQPLFSSFFIFFTEKQHLIVIRTCYNIYYMQIDLGSFYNSLIIILIIMALGFLLGRKKWINETTNKQLVNLLLMVFMPAALFNSFPNEYSDESLKLFAMGILAGFVVMVLMILTSKLIFGKKIFKGELRYEAQFAFIFNNATFLGYPLISTAFGAEGIIPYCGFIVAFNLALFSYGIWLFERKITLRFIKQIITNPNILAVFLGMILFLLQIKLPQPVTSAIGYIAGATTPLSLFCIGYMLSIANLKHILKKWRLGIIALFQLILAPLLTWLILTLMHFPTEVIIICTLIQALPTATSLGLFAEKYNGNTEESSELVVCSTLFSIATLPLVALLLFNI